MAHIPCQNPVLSQALRETKNVVHSNRFTIRNNFSGTLLLAVEPEAAIVSLAAGDEVQVSEQFDNEPVSLNVSINDEGLPLIAVWPGDGTLRVEKGGVNVLDLR
jgi:hypothetical protein